MSSRPCRAYTRSCTRFATLTGELGVSLMVLYLVIMSVGGSIPLALLIAQPLATFLLVSIYEERLQGEQLRIEKEA